VQRKMGVLWQQDPPRVGPQSDLEHRFIFGSRNFYAQKFSGRCHVRYSLPTALNPAHLEVVSSIRKEVITRITSMPHTAYGEPTLISGVRWA